MPSNETMLLEGMCIPYFLYHVEFWSTHQFSLTDTLQPESHKNHFSFIKHWSCSFTPQGFPLTATEQVRAEQDS